MSNEVDGLQLMSDFIFTSKYARYDEKKKRRETWDETVDRVEKMHLDKYHFLLEEDKKEIVKAFDFVRKKIVVPSMRSLQFAGPAVLAHNSRIFNCLAKQTTFITKAGVKSFSDFKDGDETVVLTHKGNWKKAIVRNFGEDNLNKITIYKAHNIKEVFATNDHRWILRNGEVTTNLKIGDNLMACPEIFKDFIYSESTPLERLYWCYGYTFGDGTRVTNSQSETLYSMVRLCDHARRFAYRFEEMGFTTSIPLSCNGDFIAYTGTYLKTAPNPEKDSPELIRAFVKGYLDADGARSSNFSLEKLDSGANGNIYCSIQSSELDHIEFIRKCFPIAGVYLTSEKELTGQKTNYGIRPYTISFKICQKDVDQSVYRVKEIVKNFKKEEVWCLEVEDDESFVFPSGLVTGNCSCRHIDSIRSFAECFYLLLCGCGVDFGLSKKYLSRLPSLVGAEDKTGSIVTYSVEDSIEGWSDSVEALLNCYLKNTAYSGRKIVFDYSKIRRKGAKLKTGGGKAPGYKGLKNAHQKIKRLLDHIIEDLGQKELKPINAYDILMHCADAVLSGGIRRAATSVIFDKDDEEMISAKTGNWFEENPQRARSNNSVLFLRNKLSLNDFKNVFDKVKQFGEPGFIFADNEDMLSNPCVVGDTEILTKNGYREIKELVDTPVDIWNGFEWSNVTPKITGYNKPILKIKCSDGRELTCTYNHNWIIQKGYGNKIERIEASNLKIGDKIIKHSFPILDNENHLQHPYTQGFISGDGMDDYNFFAVYGEKVSCIPFLTGTRITGKEYTLPSGIKRNMIACNFDKLPKDFVPINYSLNSKIKWLSGLFDSDGTELVEGGIQIVSINYQFLSDVQKLLSTVGLQSKICKADEEGYRLLPDGNGGEKEYFCGKTWRICIGAKHVTKLESLGLECHRLKLGKNPDRDATQYIKIVSIEDAGVADMVYCFTELKRNYGVFNGILTGQCREIGFVPVTKDGRCGVQFCNLTSINGSKITSLAEFKEASWAATVIGTLQAGYTNFHYLRKTSKELTEDESLLGVSITGMMDNPDILLNGDNQTLCAKLTVDVNETWSHKIGIKPAARITCLKPEGTSSILLMCGSGIHPHHSLKYIRRVQCNKIDPIYQFFKLYNPDLCEESVWSANKTDDVISFPIEINKNAITKKDLNAIKHLDYIKLTQKHWVNNGLTKHNKKDVSHSVSCTVVVKENEWDSVMNYLYKNRNYFAAVSLLSDTGDKDYQQAPMEAIITQEDSKKFQKLKENIQTVDYSKLTEEHDETSHTNELACSGGKCEVVSV